MRRHNKYTKEMLEEAINNSKNWAEVCKYFNLSSISGAQSHLKKRAIFFGILFPHFKGKSWSKGISKKKRDINIYLNNQLGIQSVTLRNRLINEGYKERRCEICKNDTWLGEPICLELDHKDSDHFNNELNNLQIICANCHALETKKRKQKIKSPPAPRIYKKRIVKTKIVKTRHELRKIKDRPSLKVILREVKEMGYVRTGLKYGVSDNAIRKWIIWEGGGKVKRNMNIRYVECSSGETG